MMQDNPTELLRLNQRLLDAIAQRDWATYQELSASDLTAFEPEACGQLVLGRAFHEFYFKLGGGMKPAQNTMVAPHVRILGEVAIVSYVRLTQSLGVDGPTTLASNETRIWHRVDGAWRQVHFHRSLVRSDYPALAPTVT